MKQSEIDAYDTKKLVKAFRETKIEISEKQLEDLRELFDRTMGIPCRIDANNRPQGPTIHTCKSIGIKLTKHLGEGPTYGMSWVGYINKSGNWTMRDNVRAALKQLGWFGSNTGYTQDPSVGESNADDGWSREELRAAVKAYVEMLRMERAGQPFIKKHYYEKLASQFGRTSKAFEYRMQNISYVLSLMGRVWIRGLKPAKNVGARVAGEIEELFAIAENRKSPPVVAFEIKVREQSHNKNLPKPAGNEDPIVKISSVTVYDRDDSVKAWVLKAAKGKCECCGKSAPFKRTDGEPYLEVHHVRQLADGGADKDNNAVAICPNCHRELHYGQNAQELVESLYKNIRRLTIA